MRASTVTLPFVLVVKNFLGLYVQTPFEQELLKHLSDELGAHEKEILAYQLEHFTTVRRLIHHLNEPNAYGYTNFYTLRFGPCSSGRQKGPGSN